MASARKTPRPSSPAARDETGAVTKPRADRVTAALCYPNAYGLAMGNLGFHQVYHLLNAFDQVVCERAVFEPGRPLLTIEGNRPLSGFEIVAFSISYETDLINLARMLREAGISPDRQERERANSPLILVGGALCLINPEPVAPFADLIAVGEAEAILGPLIEAYLPRRQLPRSELLAELAGLPGIYAPSWYEVDYQPEGAIRKRTARAGAPEALRRVFAADLSDPARTRVFSPDAEFGDMTLIELARGCPNGCRFCAAAYVFRPPRWAPAEAVASVLDQTSHLRQCAGLVAASITDHPGFGEVRKEVRSRGLTHSVASLRLDQITPELLDEIKEYGHKTLTVAPEAATERLRRVINKPMSDETIDGAMEMIGRSGIPRLKLYFQVGLPFEEDEDLEAVGPFIARLRDGLGRGSSARAWAGRLSLSVNPFVPKPATPFQWRPMASPERLKRALALIRAGVRKIPSVSLAGTSVREARLQAAIARGDRRTGRAVARAIAEDRDPVHAIMDGDDETPPAKWVVHREREFEEVLPWDFIDHGMDKKFLWDESGRAREARTTPPCRPGTCRLCRSCGE